LELARPRANSKASRIFDLPEPFGPETTVNPGSRGIWVVPPKDLKCESSRRLIYTMCAGQLDFEVQVYQSNDAQQVSTVSIERENDFKITD
jgi:hypothetical protein